MVIARPSDKRFYRRLPQPSVPWRWAASAVAARLGDADLAERYRASDDDRCSDDEYWAMELLLHNRPGAEPRLWARQLDPYCTWYHGWGAALNWPLLTLEDLKIRPAPFRSRSRVADLGGGRSTPDGCVAVWLTLVGMTAAQPGDGYHRGGRSGRPSKLIDLRNALRRLVDLIVQCPPVHEDVVSAETCIALLLYCWDTSWNNWDAPAEWGLPDPLLPPPVTDAHGNVTRDSIGRLVKRIQQLIRLRPEEYLLQK
jgi:hypothetical protein